MRPLPAEALDGLLDRKRRAGVNTLVESDGGENEADHEHVAVGGDAHLRREREGRREGGASEREWGGGGAGKRSRAPEIFRSLSSVMGLFSFAGLFWHACLEHLPPCQPH